MKIINLSWDDWANFSYNNAAAMRSIGIDAQSFKRRPHVFGYEKECAVVTSEQIKKEIDKADIVQLMHSDHTYLQYCVAKGKRIVVYHTGTGYRLNPVTCNQIFNPYVERCFTDQCEFIGTGMKNETYIATAIDTDKFQPKEWITKRPYIMAHYPSNPDVKGTKAINEMISELAASQKDFSGLEYRVNIDKVGHQEQMNRMQACDIYIELFAPTQYGKPYGCYGVTAFEAAALGKIVVTQNIRQDVYRKAYGIDQCPLFIANTKQDFKIVIDTLNDASEEILGALQRQSRQWIIENHSYEATGQRLKSLLKI